MYFTAIDMPSLRVIATYFTNIYITQTAQEYLLQLQIAADFSISISII
jgi:hypothetical protein